MRACRLAVALLLLVSSLPALARGALYGWAERGGYNAVSNLSGSMISVQRACPAATITVRNAGTVTSSTIYSNAIGTAKSNPFTATTAGYWHFYADDGEYDVLVSCGVVYSYTLTSLRIGAIADVVDIRTLGAVCDGVTDDHAAIQAAIDIVGAHTVQFPSGACVSRSQLLVTQNDITIRGTGNRASQLVYLPTSGNEAAIKVDGAGSSAIVHFTLRDLFISTTDTTLLKIGLWLVDTSQTIVENVQIGTDGGWRGGANVSPFTGTGSIGIKYQGRDFGTFRNVASCGAIPLYIDGNPNFPSIDLDHSSFADFYFLAFGDNPNIYIADDVQITTSVFTRGAFVKGGGGVYWPDTTSVSNSNGVEFSHIRGEQFTANTNGWMFYITNNSGLRDLRIADILCGSGTTVKGMLLRGIGTGAVIDGYTYNGTLACVDWDSTVTDIDWRMSRCQTGSTKSLGTLVSRHKEGKQDSNSPMPLHGGWETPTGTSAAGLLWSYQDVNMIANTGTLANGGSFTVPSGSGAIVTGMIMISFKGATLNGAFTCAINGARTITVATSDATLAGCTGNVAGDFTLDWVSAAGIVIRNNTGESATFNYLGFWN